MAIREQLLSEAQTVNNLLTKYIDLHNKQLKNAGSFLSLFKKVDFAGLAAEAHILLEELREETNILKTLQNIPTTGTEKELADCLFQFVKALTETVYQLFIMLNALKEKANGNDLSYIRHKENNRRYQESIDKYHDYGDKLNRIYTTVKNS